MSSDATPEVDVLDAGLAILQARLPRSWTMERLQTTDSDVQLTIRSPQGQGQVLVEVKRRFKPADVDLLLGPIGRRLRTTLGGTPILLVSAEPLSGPTRERLAVENISYVDLSGNVRLELSSPGLFVETEAPASAPSRLPSAPTFRGAQAGRVIRFLVDVRPPYGVVEIATQTGISRGYVSRLIDALADEALIERVARGPVVAVDWPTLLRRRSEVVDLLKTNTTFRFVAPQGTKAVLGALSDDEAAADLVVTGSFAAYRLAAIAAPALLALYTLEQSVRIQQRFRLLPADEGADVVILRPPNSLPLERVDRYSGVRFAKPSQVAIDCLSGPGRMPSEGEAVIEWMSADESIWRYRDIEAWTRELDDERG